MLPAIGGFKATDTNTPTSDTPIAIASIASITIHLLKTVRETFLIRTNRSERLDSFCASLDQSTII